MDRSTSDHERPRGSTHSISADRLVEDLGVVTNWPQMAKHFSLAIATIRSHERDSARLREQLAERDQQIAKLKDLCDYLEAEQHRIVKHDQAA